LKEFRKYLNPFIKLIIFAGLGYALYKQVFTNADVKSALNALQSNLIHGRGWFIIVLILTGLNWTVEAIKWRFLVNKLDRITFGRAVIGILFGISFSLFTPNRLGEYGGRVLVLKHHRIAAIVSTLIGSFSQIVINMSIGGFFCIIYLSQYLHVNTYLVFSVALLYILLASFLWVSYFNVEIVTVLFKKYSIFKKIAPYVDIVKKYNAQDLRKLLIYSSWRYGIYCMQFFLLLKVFRTGVKFIDGLVLIPNVFFIQGILPTMAIFDVSLRGQVALQILSDYASGAMFQVVAASLVLWFVNLIIPACIGGILALFIKLDE
jgi:hypothetical protein